MVETSSTLLFSLKISSNNLFVLLSFSYLFPFVLSISLRFNKSISTSRTLSCLLIVRWKHLLTFSISSSVSFTCTNPQLLPPSSPFPKTTESNRLTSLETSEDEQRLKLRKICARCRQNCSSLVVVVVVVDDNDDVLLVDDIFNNTQQQHTTIP